MAQIINSTDQLSIRVELYGRSSSDPHWITGSIAQQYYVSKENQFHTFIEGYIEVYEFDVSRLQDEMRSFLKADCEREIMKFVPMAEPSFEITFERMPHPRERRMIASVALDLATFAEITTPSVYGDNRVAIRFHTTEERFQRFGEDLLHEISGCGVGG